MKFNVGSSVWMFWLLFFLTAHVTAQNYISVSPTATDAELLKIANAVLPTERQMNWQEMEFYGFIHFGINTFADLEWSDGTIPASKFYPSQLNADQWVNTFKKAGLKGLILTAKHHDGFCLWPTKTTDYSVVNSPWKNGKGDVVREVSDACRRQGLKMGIYLSPWDRNHPSYGNSEVYNQVFREQLTELLSNYGNMFTVWFDGANGEGPNGKIQEYDFESYYALIRKLQPEAVISIMGPDVRWVGNEAGKGRDPEWSVLPLNAASRKAIAANSQQQVTDNMFVPKDATASDLGSRELLKGTTALIWYPSEADTSIRPGWFYHKNQDSRVKSLKTLEDIYYSSVGMNSTLLLNIPPDSRGLIHKNDSLRLMEFNKLIEKTFEKNLLVGSRIKAKSAGKRYRVINIADKNKLTCWKAKSNIKEPVIEIDFKNKQQFDRLLIQENIRNGQRVEKFALEILVGKNWMKVAEAKTIGYKRILRFPKVEAQKVRIRFVEFRACPEITEVGFYLKTDPDFVCKE